MKRILLVLAAAAALAACNQGPHSLAEAQKCLHAGDLKCAEANLKGYLLLKPEDLQATGLLAMIQTQSGEHKDAVVTAKKAIDGGVKDAQLYANYAGSLAANGDRDAAIDAYKKALELDPNLVDVAMSVAGMLNDSGRAADGVKVLEDFDAHQAAGGHKAMFPKMIAVMKENIGAPPPAGAPTPAP